MSCISTLFAADDDIAAAVSQTPVKSVVSEGTYYLLLEDVWHILKKLFISTNWWTVLHMTGRIAIILVTFFLIMRLLDKVIKACRPHLSKSRLIHSKSGVVNTILPITRSVFRWIFGTITMLLLLSELGVNIMPLVYSLSVIGLSVSIGSQNLVKDFLNGIMTLVEGSMTVGDEVVIGVHKGVVESISLRYVHLRHITGALHTIPFSEVGTVSNLSRDYAQVTISIICTPSASLDMLHRIFDEVYHKLHAEPAWKQSFAKPLNFHGIKRVSCQGVEVVADFRTSFADAKRLTHAFYNRLIPLCHEHDVPLVYGVSETEAPTTPNTPH